MLFGSRQLAQVRTPQCHHFQSPQILRRLDPLFSARLFHRQIMPFDEPWNGWPPDQETRLNRQMRLRAITSAAEDGW